MGPFEMVVGIVLIVTIGSIVRAKHGLRGDGWRKRHTGNEITYTDPDNARLRDEVKMLKDRVAVLERLATDDSSALDREIERLRTRDKA